MRTRLDARGGLTGNVNIAARITTTSTGAGMRWIESGNDVNGKGHSEHTDDISSTSEEVYSDRHSEMSRVVADIATGFGIRDVPNGHNSIGQPQVSSKFFSIA